MLDLLLRDVLVHTVDDARPTASAVGVLGGRVVGLDEEVVDLPARSVVDGDGAVVVPGFGDAHNHMAWFGQSLGEVDLSAAGDLAALEDAVAADPARLPADPWDVASGSATPPPRTPQRRSTSLLPTLMWPERCLSHPGRPPPARSSRERSGWAPMTVSS